MRDPKYDRVTHSYFIPKGCESQGRLSAGRHPIDAPGEDALDGARGIVLGVILALAIWGLAAFVVLW